MIMADEAVEKYGPCPYPLSSLDAPQAYREIDRLASDLSGQNRLILESCRMRIRQDERIPLLESARTRSDEKGNRILSDYIEKETRRLSSEGLEQTVFKARLRAPDPELLKQKNRTKRSPKKGKTM